MNQKKPSIESVIGIVIEALPNTLFKVRLENDMELLAYLAGNIRIHRLNVLIGDKVRVDLDPYGGKGRITQRM